MGNINDYSQVNWTTRRMGSHYSISYIHITHTIYPIITILVTISSKDSDLISYLNQLIQGKDRDTQYMSISRIWIHDNRDEELLFAESEFFSIDVFIWLISTFYFQNVQIRIILTFISTEINYMWPKQLKVLHIVQS